jgi:hypothetical protein
MISDKKGRERLKEHDFVIKFYNMKFIYSGVFELHAHEVKQRESPGIENDIIAISEIDLAHIEREYALLF